MQNGFDIRGNVTAIYLNHNGKVVETIIDTEDLEKAKSHPNMWLVKDKFNGLYVYGIQYVDGKKKTIWLHRLIMDTPAELVVDHIDHYTLDNRKKYLRNVLQSENAANRNDNKLFPGVHKYRNGYRVRIMVNGNRKDLGVYDNYEEAVLVAKKYKTKQIS